MTIDGLSPSRTLKPTTEAELAAAISEEKGAIVAVGSGRQIAYGNPLRRYDCRIDLSGLDRITAYNPADLTIHVEAGVTIGQLHGTLREHGQVLPLDPWSGPESTVGGVVATAAQGPSRAVGTIRDWIIGIRVVELSGRCTKAGGRVVKNVTGYDLMKTYTGSLGSLAVISEVSLKLRAAYPKTLTAIAEFETFDEAAQTVSLIRQSALEPISFVWAGAKPRICIRFGEHEDAVRWQIKNLPQADWKVCEGDAESACWEDVRRAYMNLGDVVVRVIAKSTELPDVLREFGHGQWLAHAGNGIALIGLREADIERVREKYRAVIERAPLALRQRIPTFGLTDAEWRLASRVKAAFDPRHRLNAGRHVDGERS